MPNWINSELDLTRNGSIIRYLWKAMVCVVIPRISDLKSPFKEFYQLLLLTGQRREEVAGNHVVEVWFAGRSPRKTILLFIIVFMGPSERPCSIRPLDLFVSSAWAVNLAPTRINMMTKPINQDIRTIVRKLPRPSIENIVIII
jgi:hypothetical protein